MARVREEMEHAREGKHEVKSRKQAIAIGLSKARQAGVPLPPPPGGTRAKRGKRSAKRAKAAPAGASKRSARQHPTSRGASKGPKRKQRTRRS